MEVLSLPSLQHHTVPLCLSPAVISRKGNVAQKHILLCQFSDLNNETEEVLHGVNTPWNLSSFWSCLSHLWSHLSPQVPLSFVVWIELFLVNWIPCLQLLIPFHPSSVLLSYASSLAVRPVCHQNQSHQVSYNNSLHKYHALCFSLSIFELFSALEVIKILLKNYVIFLAFTVFSLTFLINSSLSIYLFLSHTSKAPYFLLYSIQLLPLACASSFTFMSMHFYISAFCFSLLPYFTLCFRHTVLNALTAPNFKVLSWGQIKAVQSHYIHYCIVLAQVISLALCFGKGAEPPEEADAEVSTLFRWAGISQLSSFCWQAVHEFLAHIAASQCAGVTFASFSSQWDILGKFFQWYLRFWCNCTAPSAATPSI